MGRIKLINLLLVNHFPSAVDKPSFSSFSSPWNIRWDLQFGARRFYSCIISRQRSKNHGSLTNYFWSFGEWKSWWLGNGLWEFNIVFFQRWNEMCEGIYSNAWFHRTFCGLWFLFLFFFVSQRLKINVKIAICYTLRV